MGTVTPKKTTWIMLARVLALVPVCLAAALGGCGRREETSQVPVRPDLSGFPAGLTAALDRAEGDVRQTSRAAAAWLKLGRLYLANGFSTEARHCFQGLVDDAHEGARACHGLALVAQATGDLAEETRWLRETIVRDAAYLPARLRLARAAYKSGDNATAVAGFQHVLQRDPDNAEALVGLARERIRTGDDARAQATLEDLTTRHPKFSTGFALLAQIVDRGGEADRAALLREKARARKDPPPMDPWLDEVMESCYDVQQVSLRFEDYVKSGLEAQALASLRQLELIDPENTLVSQMRAMAAVQQGRDADAVREYERALAAGGEAPKIYPALVAALVRMQRYAEAEAKARAGLAAAPPTAELLVALADVRGKQRHADEALALLEEAVSLESDHLAANRALSRLHWEGGRRAKAVGYLEAIRRVAPSDVPARALLGEFFLEEQRPCDAVPPLTEALVIAPGNRPLEAMLALAHVRSGNQLAREGKLDEAVASYDRALAVQPATIEAHANKVQVCLRLGQHERADVASQSWLQLQPEEPAAWMMRGDVQRAAGASEQSIASWSRARQLLAAHPNPQLQEALASRLGSEIAR